MPGDLKDPGKSLPFGIDPIKVNTILLNWIEQLPKGFLELNKIQLGKNIKAAYIHKRKIKFCSYERENNYLRDRID